MKKPEYIGKDREQHTTWQGQLQNGFDYVISKWSQTYVDVFDSTTEDAENAYTESESFDTMKEALQYLVQFERESVPENA